MIILDTNVVSEIMRPEPERSRAVLDWLRAYPSEHLFSTAPTLAEIMTGIALLPAGKRRAALAQAAEEAVAQLRDRILAFDEGAARVFAEMYAQRRALGLGTSDADLQIAAIARVAGMAIATRNVTDFQECGVEVLDPWTA